jgi:hypothetical protein
MLMPEYPFRRATTSRRIGLRLSAICTISPARDWVRWTRPNTIHLSAFDLHTFNGHDFRVYALLKRQARRQAHRAAPCRIAARAVEI